ncbi:hypothetical protein SAMD00019534_091340 [Acytostelium subglobosum LB1]|uniref:hypothetical protein n=1 Tax=Acytostelium subglobosum LB1 TaxID=1410327 RepID=UPI000644A33C|nr:hypothetical protein SAMD00019534_091340 [Acytostelium subglobosum LB1]GAM25959.1 hypothetical protein SAMD00019534_091340 [Acytostelium subglobosum LB1]|eukprot:XP_012751002.1 hypothetical protein SAMD00019534_091340 [Acytostelium subglobosum LB1]
MNDTTTTTAEIETQITDQNDDRQLKRARRDEPTTSTSAAASSSSSSSGPLTVSEVLTDRLTQLSGKHWLMGFTNDEPYNSELVTDLFNNEIINTDIQHSRRSLKLLELSHYLENYLWPHFKKQASAIATATAATNIGDVHIWSIMAMVNERAKVGLPPFSVFTGDAEHFKQLFDRVIRLSSPVGSLLSSQTHLIQFLIHCYQSLEDPMVRAESLKIVSYPMWIHLSPGRFAAEIDDLTTPALQKKIIALKKRSQKEGSSSKDDIYSSFMLTKMKEFVKMLDQTEEGDVDSIRYCERFVELMVDMVNQITTRRFFYALIDDYHLLIRIRSSKLCKLSTANNFNEALNILEFYLNFPINNFTGQEIPQDQIIQSHYFRIQNLQRVVFKEFEEIKELALQNVSTVEDKTNLINQLKLLSVERLRLLASRLNLLSQDCTEDRQFITDVVIGSLKKRRYHREALASLPHYPTEQELWNTADDSGVLNDRYQGDRSLPLPKLNMQYLSHQDYLYRNYYLFKTEATYDLRADLEDALRRLSPKRNESGSTILTGWSRMAFPMTSFKIEHIAQPKVGEKRPAQVLAMLSYSLAGVKSAAIVEDWESMKEHDVMLLVSVRATVPLNAKHDNSRPFAEHYGVKSVRGCEVVELMDERGGRIDADNTNNRQRPARGHQRFIKVRLDSNQYYMDQEDNKLEQYKEFNIVVRRKSKENNFKAIQETIVSLINDQNNLPEWLANTFLGYPSDDDTNATRVVGKTIDFQDTFISRQHILDTFKSEQIDKTACLEPPYRVTYGPEKKLVIESYNQSNLALENNGGKRGNKVQFTPVQVDAIRSGSSEGLTLIVGPPGTGKTDVAVQIISNIYHNHPNQRTLIITHSNQALNQLFDKIYQLDIDERHLLRLGHGQTQLETRADFTRSGRIDYMLSLRLHRLAIVDHLAKSIGVMSDVSGSCETAQHFFEHEIKPRWETFSKQLEAGASGIKFPFAAYFQASLFQKPESLENDRLVAARYWTAIQLTFEELRECRAFELLKSANDRFNYLLLKQSRIVAMTCTHAVLRRNELVRLGFKYDNVIMEEAGQISDVETFIPLQLQTTSSSENSSRLKRLVLIGDHNQLPPVIKCSSLVRFSHLEQSMFTRFIRLGIKYIQLDHQGRCRPALAELFSWRYTGLGNLPLTDQRFTRANPGFLYETQLINVDESHGYGAGENEPFSHFYQNLGEAEYIVSVYQFMRLIGYPSESISVLTTYNGQKQLLRNIFEEKCKDNALFGMPKKITTVDKYQGQQNDYILLSLVRTKSFGHIRDVRRLVVAMSRARLGLYIFCKRSFFKECYETITIFHKYASSPDKLVIVPGEAYPTERLALTNSYEPPAEGNADGDHFVIENGQHMQQVVQSNLSS